MRVADAGVKKPEIIVDFRDRSYRGTGIVGGRLLIDGDSRRQPFDTVNIRFSQETQKLPALGGGTLDVAPMSFRVDRVKGKGTFPGSRKPGKHNELIFRKRYRDVL